MAKDEDKKDAPDPPMTTKDYEEELKKLTNRAKAAGVRTGRGILSVFFDEVFETGDRILARFEGEPEKPKRKPKKKAKGA